MTDPIREALEIAEDVLSRRPFSSEIWPNGMHPQVGIEKIRAALANLPAKTDAQPVAWICRYQGNCDATVLKSRVDDWIRLGRKVEPLYALPAKTERAAVVGPDDDWEERGAADDLRKAVIEECAKIVDAECARVLSKQTLGVGDMSIASSVNANLRMIACILPEVAANIRALVPPLTGEATQPRPHHSPTTNGD